MIESGPWLRHQTTHWNLQESDVKNEPEVLPLCVVCNQEGEHDYHMSVRCGWCKQFLKFKACEEKMASRTKTVMCDPCMKEWQSKISTQ